MTKYSRSKKNIRQNSGNYGSDCPSTSTSWTLPNKDAHVYLSEVLDLLTNDLQQHGAFREDFVYPDMENIEDLETIETELMFSWGDEYMYAPVDLSSDHTNQEFQEITENARVALDDADVQGILQSIDDLLQFKSHPPRISNIENWAHVTVNRSTWENPINATDEEPHTEIERKVIHAVSMLCVRLCELIAQDKRALRQIEWRQLEYVIATALEGIGFEVTVTPCAKDGGKDVVAQCTIAGEKYVYFVEVKHWRSGKRIRSEMIFDFVEVNMSCSTSGGLFLSTSGFVNGIFSQLAEICRTRVRLGGEDKIVSLCQHFVRRKQGIWLSNETLPTILFEQTIG